MTEKKDLLFTLLIPMLLFAAIALWNANHKIARDIHDIELALPRSDLQEQSTASVPIGDDATSFELSDTEGNIVSFNPYSSKLALLIFFNPTDCSWCLLESSLWEEMSELYDSNELYVLGIITKTNVSVRDVSVFKKGRRLKFPILSPLRKVVIYLSSKKY